ncbi:MAG TPA: AAA family ATPase [Candidatus Mediterraneibacter cottocaccae]|nr:AAA family ATPase [Candidatus Mediterraneibacter cottocaccae]
MSRVAENEGKSETGKHLYLIGGPMGVGKTTVGQILKKMLPDCVYLDGDWCWDMDPFTVTDETKRMVIENICALLNNFLKCSAYENIVFCWVMHEQGIIDEILARLNTGILAGTEKITKSRENTENTAIYRGAEMSTDTGGDADSDIRSDAGNDRSGKTYEVRKISLVCEKAELERRIRRDVERGVREPGVLERSLAYIPLYETLDTVKIDVTGQTSWETAETIVNLG